MQIDKLKFKQIKMKTNDWYPTNDEARKFLKSKNQQFLTTEEMEEMLDDKLFDIYCEQRYEKKIVDDGYYFIIYYDELDKLYTGHFKDMIEGELYELNFTSHRKTQVYSQMLRSLQEFYKESNH